MKNNKKPITLSGIAAIILIAVGVLFGNPSDGEYSFRSQEQLENHYEKHGIDMGFTSADAYLEAANEVADNPESLHKIEAEDGDNVYYLEKTNEFVIISTDGYIRTYFNPSDGIDYFNRQ